jgi:hypothetical protein
MPSLAGSAPSILNKIGQFYEELEYALELNCFDDMHWHANRAQKILDENPKFKWIAVLKV